MLFSLPISLLIFCLVAFLAWLSYVVISACLFGRPDPGWSAHAAAETQLKRQGAGVR